jgi:type II secretory pathway pseudopilin PulG
MNTEIRSRNGFTLIELFIYIALFVVISSAFAGILLAITRVHLRQASMSEVNEQSQFALQVMQSYIERASNIEMTTDVASTTIKLRMPSSTMDPTYIYHQNSGGVGYLFVRETDSGSVRPLTNSRVTVSGVSFTKRANAPGRDSINVAFTMAANTTNPQKFFQQALRSSVARVNAATFDSNVVPATTNSYKIGASSQIWQSINDLMYFANSNVGIGSSMSNPLQKLEVDGGVKLNTATARPTCDTNARGTLWYTRSGASVTDTLALCVKLGSGSYSWVSLY